MGSIGMQEILVILLIIAALGLPALIAIVVVLWVTKRNQPSSKMPPLAVSTPAEREKRLEELKSLRERDLITEAEYTEKRTQIIDRV